MPKRHISVERFWNPLPCRVMTVLPDTGPDCGTKDAIVTGASNVKLAVDSEKLALSL